MSKSAKEMLEKRKQNKGSSDDGGSGKKPTPGKSSSDDPSVSGQQSGSIFSGVKDVDGRQRRRSQKIRPGDYVLQLQRADGGPSEKEPGVNYFATEWNVLYAEEVDPDDPPNKEGALVSKAMMLKGQYAFIEVVNTVCATLGVDPDDYTDDEVQQFCDDFIVDEGDYVIHELDRDLVFCEARRNDKGYVDLYYLPIEEAGIDPEEYMDNYEEPVQD